MTFNGVIALILRLSPNSIALLAKYHNTCNDDDDDDDDDDDVQ